MKIPFKELQMAIENDEGTGFCLACGESQDDCEPDAREYTCESCGKPRVYGAEEIIIMGAYE